MDIEEEEEEGIHHPNEEVEDPMMYLELRETDTSGVPRVGWTTFWLYIHIGRIDEVILRPFLIRNYRPAHILLADAYQDRLF